MTDDVIRFRKICDNLVKGKTRTPKAIAQEMGIVQPTLKRLLTADLDNGFSIRASVLGMIQDFSKKYRDYERVVIEPETKTREHPVFKPDKESMEAWRSRLKKNKPKEITMQLDPGIQPGIRQKTPSEPGEDPFTQLKNAIERIHTELGANSMTLKITIRT